MLGLIGLFIMAFLMFQISIWKQRHLYQKYGVDFNSERRILGLEEISEHWKLEKLTWNEWERLIPPNEKNGTINKLTSIFSGKNIETGFIYQEDSLDFNRLHKDKFMWFNSNILYWKNEIMAESDSYQKLIDSITVGNLSVTYHFKDENGNMNYFEANYSENAKDEGFWCGTPAIMEKEGQGISKKPHVGNITKQQADSILNSWGGK